MNKRYIQYEAHYPSGGERSGICSIYGGARTLSATESKQPTSVLIPINYFDICLPVLTPDRVQKRQNGRRFKENGEESFTLTAQDKHGVAIGIEPSKCICIQGQRIVENRKYEVDKSRLIEELRIHRKEKGLSNNQISQKLDIPITQVEHYFRQDDYWAIPEPEIWFKLKKLLDITTTEFDEAITTFEQSIGKFEKGERFYDADGLCPTLTANSDISILLKKQSDNRPTVLITEATKKGYAEAHEGDSINLTMPESQTRRGRVGGGVAQTLDTQCNQGIIVTAAGDIPSDNQPGYVVEIYPNVFVWAVWYEKYQCYIAIRKLTPRECFRLQGWTDDYFDRAQFVNSDSQLYKQAGNGVTVNVVYEIARRMEITNKENDY